MKLVELIDIQPHDVKWLYDKQLAGLLEVDNSFQRNYVWTTKNQVQLIESIILGYPVPEIYIWNTGTDEETGDTQYSIVDGQQRTGAIFQFITNDFKLYDKSLSSNSGRFKQIKNRYFKDLETADKKAIWAYVFSIRIIRQSVSREKIVNMFLRLNSNNMTLNPQELRNAEFEGEFMNVSSSLAELPFWEKNKLFSLADRRRMKDISFVSVLLVFMKLGIEEDILNTNLNKTYDLYNDEYPAKDQDIERFEGILSEIDAIIGNNTERVKILNKQVHFYSLFTTIYELTIDRNKLSSKQKQNYITFIDNYDNVELLHKNFSDILPQISIYKSLSKEGTRSKSNRIERHKVIKAILNH